MQAVVQKWGDSLGFRIPYIWAEENNIKNPSEIEVVMEQKRIVILPKKKSLDDMMAMVNDSNIHSPVSTSSPVGKEEW